MDHRLEIGKWLDLNGEAIYETSPWLVAGEGPTGLEAEGKTDFNESGIVYTREDIRFTIKGDNLYAILLDWPGEKAVITTLRSYVKPFFDEDKVPFHAGSYK